MSILQKIADIESEMARTQKNKATNAHLGILKAKLAKLRRELITPKGGGGGAGEAGFDVANWRCPHWICRLVLLKFVCSSTRLSVPE